MVVGFAGTLGMCVLNLIIMQQGGGLAIVDVPEPKLRVFLKVSIEILLFTFIYSSSVVIP